MKTDETRPDPSVHHCDVAGTPRQRELEGKPQPASSRHPSDLAHVLSVLGLRGVPTVITFR